MTTFEFLNSICGPFQMHNMYNIFPQNVAAVRFNFRALYYAVTIRGRLDFEASAYRDRYTRTYTTSIMGLFVCTYNARAHMYIIVDPVPCGKILRAAFIGMCWLKYAATFRGQQDFEVRRDFEEIQYVYMHNPAKEKHNF